MVYCNECKWRRMAKFGKAFKAGLCSYCAYHKGLLVDREAINARRRKAKYKSCQSMIRTGGKLPRQKKDNPTLAVGLKLHGSKFQNWAEDYIKENL